MSNGEVQSITCSDCGLMFDTAFHHYALCNNCYAAKYGKKCSQCQDLFCTKYIGKNPLCSPCFHASFPQRPSRTTEVSSDGFRVVRRR